MNQETEKAEMLKRRKALKFSGVLLAILVIAVSTAVGLGYRQTAVGQSSDEQLVRDALLKSASSFRKNDLATATQVWANDESLTVFESGHANYGWVDYRDNHLGPEMREMKNTRYAFSDIKIHLAGKTAWATFRSTIAAEVMDNGKQRHVDGGGLGTAVLEQRDGQWRIVHWHSSAPRRAALRLRLHNLPRKSDLGL